MKHIIAFALGWFLVAVGIVCGCCGYADPAFGTINVGILALLIGIGFKNGWLR